MIKKIASLVFTLFVLTGYVKAQTGTQTASLVTSASKIVVDPLAKYYYLYEKGTLPSFTDIDTIEFKRYSILKDVPLSELLEAVKADTASIDWHQFNLPGARVVDKGHLPKYVGSNNPPRFKYVFPKTSQKEIQNLYDQGIIPVKVSPRMSKADIEYQYTKAQAAYENRPAEQKASFSFSKPVFSKDGNYAIINLFNLGQGDGGLYIFKFDGNQWVKLFEKKVYN